MDLTAPLIFISLFILASISLFLVYKYGIKKKSYEEALAEQRRRASILLGQTKPKLKEKKKKAIKKQAKDKVALNSLTESDDMESKDSVEDSEKKKAKSAAKHSKSHVEFKEEPEEVPLEPPVEKEVKEIINNKKRGKKVKPILVKKSPEQEIALLADHLSSTANHFEAIHPKDEVELRLNNIEEPKEEKKQEKAASRKNKQQKAEEKSEDIVQAVAETPKLKEENVVVASLTGQEPTLNIKEKKKKKSEFNSRQQLMAERDQLIYAVRNAELSRTEVQLLIDLLLNKQLEAPAVIDDWSEGKSDPVQKLKKQLADKEKQLADEQEALAAVQAKLKEVRNEQLSDRAQLQLKLRSVEESNMEMVAAHGRLQQKNQELEANFQRLVEDNKALQMQRSQWEAGYQENEAIMLNLKAENHHLNTQCQLLTQQRQELNTSYQTCLLQSKTMERNCMELSAKQEEACKLAEKLRRVSETYLAEEQKLKDIISQQKAEIQELQEEKKRVLNGSSEEKEIKCLNLTNELSSLKSELGSVSQCLLEAEKKYETNLLSSQQKYNEMRLALEEQKKKNDELRQKNWKVMEALNIAESRNKPLKESDIKQITSEITMREQEAQKEFLQRLFPEIVSLKAITSKDWRKEFEQSIRQHIQKLEEKQNIPENPELKAEIVRLQGEVQHYEHTIDETEGILRKLELKVIEEEQKWRLELCNKDLELRELKDKFVPQLQDKVSSLEEQLAKEQAEKTRLLEERFDKPEIKSIRPDSAATIEKLSEELDRLREQLNIEQSKNTVVYQNGDAS